MRAYPAFVEENKKLVLLNERLDYSDVGEIEIIKLFRFTSRIALRFQLTPELKRSIIDFLHRYHAKQDLSFSCYSYACLYAGQSLPTDTVTAWDAFWKIKNRWFRRKKVGDVVFLLNRKERHFHAAVYIGWVCMSQSTGLAVTLSLPHCAT
jgi:hypothetical protein